MAGARCSLLGSQITRLWALPRSLPAEDVDRWHAGSLLWCHGRRRRRRVVTVGKAKPRNVRLSDDDHDRLWMLARQRRQSVSACANDLLDKSLPRWVVKKEG